MTTITFTVIKVITIIAVAGLTLPTLSTSHALAETGKQRSQQSYPPLQPETNHSYPNRGYGRGKHHHGGNSRHSGMYNLTQYSRDNSSLSVSIDQRSRKPCRLRRQSFALCAGNVT